MKKYLKLLGITLISLIFISGCGSTGVESSQSSQPKIQKDYKQVLDNAKKIEINKSFFSLGKKYDIYVDGEQVAEVKGKVINNFGDTFTMTDMNGNFLIQESELKRWGLKLNRMAEIKDQNDNVLGYIGEETLSKLFSIGYTFHFYDKDQKEIGISDQVDFSLWKQNDFYDNNKEVQYHVDQKLNGYILTVNNSKQIPLYDAILMVTIEDAIHDAKDK